jgi:hypothetical protein
MLQRVEGRDDRRREIMVRDIVSVSTPSRLCGGSMGIYSRSCLVVAWLAGGLVVMHILSNN